MPITKGLPVNIDIDSYKPSPDCKTWDLPAWGHPIGQGVLPLFFSYGRVLYPIGTAFTIGRGIQFVITAKHNVDEAIKREPQLSNYLYSGEIPHKEVSVNRVDLWVMHHHVAGEKINITLRPLEFLNAAPPTDLVFGFPQFSDAIPSLAGRLTFDPPTPNEPVWCIGYAESSHPTGIDFESVLNGKFNWITDYSHKLRVAEGRVANIITQRFARGFVDGPCFTVDKEICHSQSGGPVIKKVGADLGLC